ncbi:biopolymer transporter ExbB, partial [Vibrio vulnificus]
NITPNDLAEGLGLAMRTTAAGLLIALPAIASAQLLGLWADRVMSKLEHSLNYVNLWLEGVSLQHVSPGKHISEQNKLQVTAHD